MAESSHYPNYDVMREQNAWNEHTRKIVSDRLFHTHGYHFLSETEAEQLRAWCSLLMDDPRTDVIQYVLSHIDSTLAQNKGEGQRPAGTLEQRDLIRKGLISVEVACQSLYGQSFYQLSQDKQRSFMEQVVEQRIPLSGELAGINQKAFFQKLLLLTIESYYSHPKIWSEIGYGGPAYPRGYVRADREHLDPWEAQTDD
ncbi:gluconate 2-dehydrogenase subunit 3 family protein [Paenibacillus larvae]